MKYKKYYMSELVYILLMIVFVLALKMAYSKVDYPNYGFFIYIYENPLIVFTYILIIVLADFTVLRKQNSLFIYFRKKSREVLIQSKYKLVFILNLILNGIFIGFLIISQNGLILDVKTMLTLLCLFFGTLCIFQFFSVVIELMNLKIKNTLFSVFILLGTVLGVHFFIRFIIFRTFQLGYIFIYAIMLDNRISIICLTLSLLIVCMISKEILITKYEKTDILRGL